MHWDGMEELLAVFCFVGIFIGGLVIFAILSEVLGTLTALTGLSYGFFGYCIRRLAKKYNK